MLGAHQRENSLVWSYPNISKAWVAAWYWPGAQGREKGSCGMPGGTARALANQASQSLPWSRIFSETHSKFEHLAWKRIYFKEIEGCSQVPFQLSLGQHLWPIILSAVKHSVYIWETNPLLHLLFLCQKTQTPAVIMTWEVLLKQLFCQERWELQQRKKNWQERPERFEPPLEQA